MKRVQACVFFCCFSVFFLTALHAETINFEPPAYTAGLGLPGPWVTHDDTEALIINSAPLQGTQSLSVRGTHYYMNTGRCSYPLSVPATGSFTVSATVRPTSYNPGKYDPGYVSLGSFRVWNAADWSDAVFFEMQKPYMQTVLPVHRQIWARNSNIVIGYFVDGGVYDISYTWDWDADTLTLRVVGSGGVDITLVYESTEHAALTKIVCEGNHQMYPGATVFDNIFMGQVDTSIVGDFDRSGGVDVVDYATIAASWMTIAGEPNWNIACNLDNAGDSEDIIDFADLKVLCDHWLSESD